MMSNPLSEQQQAMIPIAAFTAKGDMVALGTALHHGLDVGMTINGIKEILVQLYAYAGFPRSLNALSAFMTVLAQRQQRGLTDEVGREASSNPEPWDALVEGTRNQTRLVGQPVTGALFAFAPAIDGFLKSHLFGDIFQRDVLDWQTRELATIGALAAMAGVNNQLKSHLAMSLNTGWTVAQLRGYVSTLKASCGDEMGRNAEAVLNELLASQQTGDAGSGEEKR
ncbi:carboxymuconolactone decarboxylase family protein [Aeromonas sp. NJAU223]|uniref:carboxymuconolactone decarboxylase family protein n=1 Tax=Aeromonas sp. NJAU223 TaxID=3115650 RepID=UPI003DA9C7A7